ncbi:DNA mismatch repair protein MutL [Clostridiaceae bacterium JG1575]|nr:DNA mismatch repair protein MutL [Clostridiaceae bacterium JG1575]
MTEPRIHLLDPETASKIAAGEVVEKPASVVKELVENALDAKAKSVEVEIQNGGLDLIRILDNGHGILREDMRNAFLPHATSKIRAVEDIYDIQTLGFRGEALASVAAVSRTLLKSHAQEEADGSELFMEGGEEKFFKYAAMGPGTLIEVKDLFFNVPARLKFLKTPQREGAYVTEVMTKLALSRPDIAFTYRSNGKELLKTYGTGRLLDVITTVYNRRTAQNVTAFDHESDGIRVHGFLGNEDIARGSRSQQTLFLNGRSIQSRRMAIAVEQAFKSFITINKFPFFVLNLELPQGLVDVNVHPQKAEVKFSDENLLFRLVFDTVHGALREAYRDKLDFDSPPSAPEPLLKSDGDAGAALWFGESTGREAFGGPVEKERPSLYGGPTPEVRIPLDLQAPKEREAGGQDPVAPARENPWEDPVHLKELTAPPLSNAGELLQPMDGAPLEKFPMPHIIGQYHNTYILAEWNHALYLVDQHAAHEKINFEHYMKELHEGNPVAQGLLVPYVLDLSLDDFNVYQDHQDVFKEAGFTLEEFGERSISVREVPLFLAHANVADYFHEILDNLKNLGRGTSKEVRYLRIATAACKASIKAHDELSLQEMASLMNRLRFLEEPFTCPHGRPTMIHFNLKDVEKLFRRIL